MPTDREDERRVEDWATLERCWLSGQRLAEAWRCLRGTVPISPEELVAADEGITDPLKHDLANLWHLRIDAYLFRLGAAFRGFENGPTEIVLLATRPGYLPLRFSYDLQDLESDGAIPSADRILDLQERIWRLHLLPTLGPEARLESLRQAIVDGEALVATLVQFSWYIQDKGLLPGVSAFEEDLP